VKLIAVILIAGCLVTAQTRFSGATFTGTFGPPSNSFDPSASIYFTAITTAGGTISSSDKVAINNFVLAAKAHGYWNNLLEVYPLTGNQLAAGLVKLKAFSGSPATITNSNFTSGEYGQTTGFQGSLSQTHYLDTGFDFANLTPTQMGMAFWIRGRENAARTIMGVSILSGPWAYMSTQSWSNTNTATGNTSVSNQGYGTGFYHALKRSATSTMMAHNGFKETDVTTSATGSATRSITVTLFGAHYNSGNVFDASPVNGTFAALDDGAMSDSQAVLYAADVTQLQSDLGRLAVASYPMNHVAIIGQSLSTADHGAPALSTSQSYQNRMFDGGVLPAQNDAGASGYGELGSLVPLKEGNAETIASGFGNQVASMWRASHPSDASHDVMVSDWGKSGFLYSQLAQGTTPYNNSISGMTRAKALAPLEYSGTVNTAMLAVHGESDANSTTYQADIETWQSNYQTDIRAITGQSQTIPMFHSQVSSSGPLKSSYAMLAAYEAHPTLSVVVCPKYFLTYFSDGLHLINTSYRELGEYYAKAYYAAVVLGGTYSPLRPLTVTKTNATTITLQMAGQVGNLVIDTTNVTDPAAASGLDGFEVVDDSGVVPVSSVVLTNASTGVVTVTVSRSLSTNPRLRYAYTPPASCSGTCGGPTTGPRGNLRDSDPTVGISSGANLYNWCVHFDKPVL
jgi:hypothetical protein